MNLLLKRCACLCVCVWIFLRKYYLFPCLNFAMEEVHMWIFLRKYLWWPWRKWYLFTANTGHSLSTGSIGLWIKDWQDTSWPGNIDISKVLICWLQIVVLSIVMPQQNFPFHWIGASQGAALCWLTLHQFETEQVPELGWRGTWCWTARPAAFVHMSKTYCQSFLTSRLV